MYVFAYIFAKIGSKTTKNKKGMIVIIGALMTTQLRKTEAKKGTYDVASHEKSLVAGV